MAITISKQPTSPNMANNDLLFVVDSTQKNQAQFQYVCDIYDATATYNSSSANYLQRIRQQPNPSGYGVFNVGQILSQFTGDDEPWKTEQFMTSSLTEKEYTIRFGEQYGTSVSSSISTYNGINTTPSQNPFLTGASFYGITNGLVDPYDAVDFNFASSSYYIAEAVDIYNTFSHQVVLSNAPTTQKVQDGEYLTLSAYNGNFNESDVVAQNIAYVDIRVYNSAGTSIQTIMLENIVANGGGPKVNGNDLWSAVAGQQTAGTKLLHIGVGPQNLSDGGNTLNTAWDYYTVTLLGAGDDGLDNTDGVWGIMTFQKDTAACDYEGVRFAWKNPFGVWDYYTFKLQSDASVAVTRNDYEKTFVDYSTATSTIDYNQSRRGNTQYYNQVTRTRTANTDFLSQAEADWLRELFLSANVYIQEGTEMHPVVITTAQVTERTNPRNQKTFQYAIDFEPANQLRARL